MSEGFFEVPLPPLENEVDHLWVWQVPPDVHAAAIEELGEAPLGLSLVGSSRALDCIEVQPTGLLGEGCDLHRGARGEDHADNVPLIRLNHERSKELVGPR